MDKIVLENKQQPILTIAVPTYNGARTIKDMLNLLLVQYDPRVEILISDNCSTDKTPEIIAEYMKRYPFIRYIRNEVNGGADSNFLQCMRLASGKFTMMISDDDIIVENAVGKILLFLAKNPNISLAYLDAVGFRDKYIDLNHCHHYKKFSPVLQEDITTTDKTEFLHYAQRLFGFTSTLVWSTERFKQIENPERFFGTYFLQSYIHILCSNNKDDLLGLIKGPCIAVGEYGIIVNFDTALVEGIFYQKMIEYASEFGGYNKKQFNKYYIWKICFQLRNTIIKERAAGVKKTKINTLIKCTWKYPRAWISLYPIFLIPPFICKAALKFYRKWQGRSFDTYVNRPT